MWFDPLLRGLYRPPMLAERLKLLRAERGWTQTELAAKAGVSQQLITKIENGKIRESRKLPRLAAAFGLTVEQLMAGESRRSRGEPPSSRQSATRWPFLRLRPADFDVLAPHQVSEIEDLVEDRIARFTAQGGPRRRRKSQAA